MITDLDVEKPGLDLADASLAVRHFPHGEVEGAVRQEALVRRVVFLLQSKASEQADLGNSFDGMRQNDHGENFSFKSFNM